MEWLKELLVAIGGGATVLIGCGTILKWFFSKLFDKVIDNSFEKQIEKYRNILNRKTTAYELLLGKEFTYYSSLEVHLAKLIPIIQDLVIDEQDFEIDELVQRKLFKENFSAFIKMIPELKNDVLIYQAYIPEKIFSDVSSLVNEMQSELTFWNDTSKSLFKIENKPMDINEAKLNRDKILAMIALIETTIKIRLTELSEAY